MIFGTKKLESWGYRVACLHDHTFSRFDTKYRSVTDTQSDTHTHTDTRQHNTTLAYRCVVKVMEC